MRGDGRGPDGCEPVNECVEATPCFPGVECHDFLHGYECSICPHGFHGESLRGYDIHDTSILTQVLINRTNIKIYSILLSVPSLSLL